MFEISFWEWFGVVLFGVIPTLMLVWAAVWVLRHYNADLKARQQNRDAYEQGRSERRYPETYSRHDIDQASYDASGYRDGADNEGDEKPAADASTETST